MILGIDSSAGRCAVALVAHGAVLARVSETMDRGHAERLFPLIETTLGDAGATIAEVTRLAVCTGPGSFTGLRVGVAAARGLALGRGVPVTGVTRFQAVAAGISRPATLPPATTTAEPPRTAPRALEDKVGWAESRPIAVALAGRGSVFLQRFGPDGAALSAPAMLAPPTLAAAAQDRDVRAGDGWAAAGLAATLAPDGLADPAVVALLAAEAPADTLPVPLYLRGADAEPPREAPPVLLD